MKRLLSILSVVCVLASCENGGLPEVPNNEPKPIAFGEVSTRADVEEDEATMQKIEANGFGVYAFVNKGTEGTDATTYKALFNEGKEEVTKGTLGWTYDNVEYWEVNRQYHFMGIYPYATTSAITRDASNNPTGVSYTFKTPKDADSDLLTAYTPITTGDKVPDESVTMNFNHVLAKVFFKVDYDTEGNKGDKFVLKEFSISNIKSEGTLSMPLSEEKGTWSVNSLGNINFLWESESESDEKLSEETLWENGLMLIPQTITPSTVNIKVKYTFTDHYVDENQQEVIAPAVDKEVNTYLPAITWKPGVQYTYKMTLHEDDLITFKQIEVATWGSPQQGGAIIIK